MTAAGRVSALWIGAAVACAGAASVQADAGITYDRYYGTVQRVIDGDTLVVRVRVWPRMTAEYAVRVRGIDAPEIHRPGCRAERHRGSAAKAHLAQHYAQGTTVRLDDIQPGAFSGRVVADVGRRDGDRWLSLGDEMVSAGMAVRWRPGQPKAPWCDLAENAAPGG